MQPPDDGGFIRISSNENARGPGRKTMDALRNTITPRVGRGYPPDYTGDLVATIADIYGVGRDHVIVATGSGPILEAGDPGVLLGREAARHRGADVWNRRTRRRAASAPRSR